MLLLERTVWKMKKRVRIITERSPLPLEVPIRRRHRAVRQKPSNNENAVDVDKADKPKVSKR